MKIKLSTKEILSIKIKALEKAFDKIEESNKLSLHIKTQVRKEIVKLKMKREEL